MEDHRTVARLLFTNCFMAKIDLKDAYFLLPIHKNHRKYLRFQVEGNIYEYNCLPFGLNVAPRIFTKLMKPVFAHLRKKGLISVVYLDDILLFGNTRQSCVHNVKETLKLITSLGFLPNLEKSQLVPSQEIEYLGFVYNSIDMSISLPSTKISKTLKLLNRFSLLQRCSIRDLATVLGTLTSVCPAVKYGWLYTKLLEREKYLALGTSGNYNKEMDISSQVLKELQWWLSNLPCAINPIRLDVFSIEIFSDASLTGWGISCSSEKSRGFWSDSERHHHINYLELLAVSYGLKCFAANLSNCNILCRVDNSTALAYINKMGSIKFPKLNELARIIWQWCETRNLFIYASYIKSSDNIIADAESRCLKIESEWSLNVSAFNKILDGFGQPEIDLFATKNNAKCTKFVSWLRDPESIAIDAFTIDWKNFFFYAFPPFALILRVLRKIITDKARGILIVPLWSSQPWYPLFTSLLEGPPIIFKPNRDLLLFNRIPHPLWRKTTLVAGIVSSKP
ncbi:uncharacterized protein LOC116161828 isoform X1 [Photinus pyralis]|uniref:uncharacterized protein LOC116161828 isoform X1 n=1 Tax=Photinus pyralis TaxID=7054 RepID=UPI0012674C7B|nr:uncharacterized protein LOC116161828 isoform X1 [Photinus pyralis]